MFSGDTALKKAEEVRTLVAALRETGIQENQVKLRSVRLNSKSFAVLKTSSAMYELKVADVTLDALPGALSAIANHKHCKLEFLKWNYSKADETQRELRAAQFRQNASDFAWRVQTELLGGTRRLKDCVDEHRRVGEVVYGGRRFV
ncbi:MAG: hypothetical protein MI757_14320 [Pirellulales bacterium]|nr:hypothetical protein [Pirellulales bacterium]